MCATTTVSVDQMEKFWAKVLKTVLDEYAVRRARPVMSWRERAKVTSHLV